MGISPKPPRERHRIADNACHSSIPFIVIADKRESITAKIFEISAM